MRLRRLVVDLKGLPDKLPLLAQPLGVVFEFLAVRVQCPVVLLQGLDLLKQGLFFSRKVLPASLHEFESLAQLLGLRVQFPVFVGQGRDLLKQGLFFSRKVFSALLHEFELVCKLVLIFPKFMIESIDLVLEDPVPFLEGRHHALLFHDLFYEPFVFLDQGRVVGRASGQQGKADEGDPDQMTSRSRHA